MGSADKNTIKIALRKGNVDGGTTGGNNNGTATGDKGFVTGEDVAKAINKSGFNLTAEGENGSLVNPGERVDLKAKAVNKTGHKNLVIAKTEKSNDVEFDLAKDLRNLDLIVMGDEERDDVVSIGKNGINAGSKKITNVADGEISATSKDAINGSQLFDTKKGLQDDIASIAKEFNESGLTFVGDTGTTKQNPNTTLKVVGDGNNISTEVTNGQIAIKMSATPTFDTVQVGGANGPKIQAIKDKDGKPTGEIAFTKKDAKTGKDVLTTIKAAPGKADNDLATVGQLKSATGAIYNKIDDLEAGIAGAHAAASLGQPHDPGASTIGAAVGSYGDEQALSIGVANISNNGRWILKGHGTVDTSKKVGVGASINYQW